MLPKAAGKPERHADPRRATADTRDHRGSAAAPSANASRTESLPVTLPSPDGPTRTANATAAGLPPGIAPASTRSHERYQVLAEFGRGGIGRVSRAHDRELGRDVAIKELITRNLLNEVRFLREAMITARLEHPSIVPVHGAGRWPDGTPFYAMKLVSGRPLRDLMVERKTVDQRIGLLHHVIAVADAIAYAHGRNIIHRDLKPANVIIGDFGETIVIDWGLAKDLSSTEESDVGGGPFRAPQDNDLTGTGAVFGTPSYMAPEQERGERVDQRADVFAIGIMLWELCALDRVAPADHRLRHRILRRAGIEHDLAVIVVKALDPDPRRRYRDAGALAADLKAFKSGAHISARNYSLLALLVHWTRRHRTLALSLAVLVVLAAVGGAIYVRDITSERDRADSALGDARRQAQRAMLASAALLLERDPTQAWSVLAALEGSDPETTLLRARIAAAGVADKTIAFPTRLERVVPTPSRSRLVVSTLDRSLHVVDLQTGAMRRLPGQTTEPPMFTVTDDFVYVVDDAVHLSLIKVSLSSEHVEPIAELTELPLDLQVSEMGIFLQSGDGTLRQLTSDHTDPVVARGIEQFSLVGKRLVFCDSEHTLVVKEPRTERRLGPCVGLWSWAQSGTGFAVPADDARVSLSFNDEVSSIPISGGHHALQLVMTESGLVSAVDSQGRGAVKMPGSDSFKLLHVGTPAFETDAFGAVVAWSFRDGAVKVIDTASNREWSFKAHDHGMYCLRVVPPGDRMVTCGPTEVRLWTLPRDAPTPVASLPALAFNVARNEQGDLLFDGTTGKASLLAHGEASAKVLHSHTVLAFSPVWCGARACSGSWDGRVLCTSTANGTTEEVARFGTATRWLAAGGGRCFVAVSNGGLHDLSAPATPLYRHDVEPYRVSVSPPGTLLASTDWGGSVKVWDVTRQRMVADLQHLHDGLAVNAAWIDGERLVTAGLDGNIHLLGNAFRVERTWHLPGPVKYLSAGRDAIEAVTSDGTVWSVSLETGLERSLSIGTTFTAFAMSPRRTVMALGSVDGELFLIDRQFHVSARRPAYGEHGRIACAAFEDEATVLACLPSARVMRIRLSH
jgi:WD40 repeat protein